MRPPGLLNDFAVFGPSVFRDRVDVAAFLMRMARMFRSVSRKIHGAYSKLAADFDLTVQTQGIFDGGLSSVPSHVYTDSDLPRCVVGGQSGPAHVPRQSLFRTPSLIESLGIVAVEASRDRLPVVAARIDGFRETVTGGERVCWYRQAIRRRSPRPLTGCSVIPPARSEWGKPGSHQSRSAAGCKRGCVCPSRAFLHILEAVRKRQPCNTGGCL